MHVYPCTGNISPEMYVVYNISTAFAHTAFAHTHPPLPLWKRVSPSYLKAVLKVKRDALWGVFGVYDTACCSRLPSDARGEVE